MTRTRSRARRWLVLSGAAAVIAAATVPIGTTRAGADPLVPLDPFVNGEAQGISQAIRLVPGIGSFQVAVAIGTSIAGYTDTEGKAQAQNLDPGAVGTSLTGPQCDGSNPEVTGTQLPQPIVAESPDGKAVSKQADVTTDASNLGNTDGSTPGASVVPASSPADAGVLKVSSDGTPSGTASTDGAAFSLASLVTVSGASTSAHAAVVGGAARDVTTEAHVGSVTIAGVVQLGNITETAHQRTGAGAVAEGGFTIGSIAVAGQQLPVDASQLASSFAAVNAALAPTGIHVTLPAFTKLDDGTASMSPLSVGVTNSALLAQTLGTALSSQTLLQSVEDQLVAANCQAGTVLGLADLFALNPLTGVGSLNLLIGGMTATSDGTTYDNPFGSGGALGAGLDAGLGSGDDSSLAPDSGAGLGAGSTGDLTGATDGSAGTAGTPATAPQPQLTKAADQTVIGAVCDTTHLFRHPGCSGNHAVPVAAGVLAVVVGLAWADGLAGRGRLRRRGRALEQLKL